MVQAHKLGQYGTLRIKSELAGFLEKEMAAMGKVDLTLLPKNVSKASHNPILGRQGKTTRTMVLCNIN